MGRLLWVNLFESMEAYFIGSEFCSASALGSIPFLQFFCADKGGEIHQNPTLHIKHV